MANIKSAKKRILVSRTRADRNKAIRSGVKTAIKKVYAAIETGDKEAAKAELVLLPRPSRWLLLRAFTTRTTLQERFPV